MKRTKEEALQTRQALIDAAVEVFCRRGVARATLAEIAEVAGLTRGALYWHFENKEALFDAMCQQHFAGVRVGIGAIDADAPQGDAWQSLLDMTVAFLQHLGRDAQARKFYTILHLQCEATDETQGITRLLNGYRQMRRGQILEVLQHSQRQRRLPPDLDVERACTMCIASLFGLISVWLAQPESFDLSAEAPRMVCALADMVQHSTELRGGGEAAP